MATTAIPIQEARTLGSHMGAEALALGLFHCLRRSLSRELEQPGPGLYRGHWCHRWQFTGPDFRNTRGACGEPATARVLSPGQLTPRWGVSTWHRPPQNPAPAHRASQRCNMPAGSVHRERRSLAPGKAESRVTFIFILLFRLTAWKEAW